MTMSPRQRRLLGGALSLLLGALEASAGGGAFTLAQTAPGLELKTPDGRVVLQYMTRKPADSKLTANSTCCFYPVFTPSGTRVIDFAPDDHPHHRGIFLAWHDISGGPGGDFWGWGKFAPTEGRAIVNKDVRLKEADSKRAVIEVENEWRAGDAVLVQERLTAVVSEMKGAYLIDLHYELTPRRNLTLGQSAFSGFCVKSRKQDGKFSGPGGPVTLAKPHHLKPESDWPAEAWYDYSFSLEGGGSAGVAVIDHAGNPETTWHNVLPIAMINPCIVAPAAVELEAGEPLALRYRLVIHDGAPPQQVIADAARGFARD
jgi:hypothetical protein